MQCLQSMGSAMGDICSPEAARRRGLLVKAGCGSISGATRRNKYTGYARTAQTGDVIRLNV